MAMAFYGLAMLSWPTEVVAGPGDQFPGPPPAADGGEPAAAAGRDLFLAVTINGKDTDLVAAFHQDADGTLTIDAEQLRNSGILPQSGAAMADKRIRIDRLASVRYVYDELNQSIAFTAANDQRTPRRIDARAPAGAAAAKRERLPASSALGAVLNYSLVGATDNSDIDGRYAFSGLSGAFEARVFGPLGVFETSFIASTSDDFYSDSTRLDSTWRYSDPSTMITYSAGDIITGGLGWTRPTRLGGIQVQRNFALRSDLVTFPVPELSGSAAVPSTVDVYLDNARRFSGSVDAGPFEIANLPVVDGAGNARVVVTDAQGQQVTTQSSFIASNQLLSPGLSDFSAELGLARQNYGVHSNEYDDRPYGAATLRTGIADWLTLEGHAEGGQDLLNGGIGAVVATPFLGVVSVSAAGSHTTSSGYQFGASFEKDVSGIYLSAKVQRSFGDYQDIASVTADLADASYGYLSTSADPPRALVQVSASVPLMFDQSTLNASFTDFESTAGERRRVVGLSYSRGVFNGGTLSVSAIKDLEADGFGIFANLVIPFGERQTASTAISFQEGDVAISERIVRSQGQKIGDYGWSVARQQSDDSVTSAAASYRTKVANVSARVDQRGDLNRASLKAAGAVVAAGGGVFLSNPIQDAFAIVDVGAPDVEVQFENRAAGVTDRNGKLLLPRLRSYENNRISIDPTNLPLDAVVNKTRDVVIPADRSGIVVRFDVDTHADAALVTFVMPDGSPVEMGAVGRNGAEAVSFITGYDGQALVENLSPSNRVSVTLRDGSLCVATFPYKAEPGQQVSIRDAICKP
jgi:outer membrane usher protein